MKLTKGKKILSVLLSVVMLMCIIPMGIFTANAATDGIFMYSVSNGEATIIGCDSSATGDIFIPSVLGECPVTEISLYSFAECEGITGVSIPDSITKIGHYAFSDCTALKNVIIGKGVENLGNNVFSNCTGLEKISVSAENTAYASDENGVLYNKAKTELLVFPCANASETYTIAENVKTVADSTFAGSRNVKTIIAGDNVTAIGANAFLGSRSLEKVILGKGVATIGNDAFEGCAMLGAISVSADNTVYASDADGVLYNKAKTEIIKYPAGSIKTAFTVPEKITDLRILSFSNAVNLKSVTFTKDIKKIGNSAFSGCTGITEVYFNGTEDEWKNVTIGTNNNAILNAKITFTVGQDHGHSYTSSVTTAATCTSNGVLTYKCECGRAYTEVIYAKGHAFADNVCSACSEREFVLLADGTNAKIKGYNGTGGAIVIPETLEGYKINAIADSAFENKTSIISVTLPSGIKDIGSLAFYNTGFYNTSSNWENGVLYAGSFLIEANNTVKGAYTVKEGTQLIADYAFASRKEITSITLPEAVSVIGDSAFSGCTGITSVTVNVTEEEWKNVTIGSNNEPFTGAQFTYKVIPHEHNYVVTESLDATCTEAGYTVSKCECGDVKRENFSALGHKFENNVCSGCGEREFNISISGEEVTVLGCHASLSGDVKIPETISGYKVTAIAEKAFAGNTKIEKLTIPSGVKTIGDLAFAGSKIVVEISAGNESFIAENGVIYNKTKLALLYCPVSKAQAETSIPVGVKVIGAGAFYGITSIETVKIPDSVKTIGKEAFSGCTAIKNVYFDGTKTEWSQIAIAEGNEALTNAAIVYADTSDVELAAALAEDVTATNATVKAEEIVIVITAEEGKDTIEISKTTASEKALSVKTEGTSIAEAEDKYILTFADYHKAGNKTETEITSEGNTYVLKIVFPVGENEGHDYSITEKIEASCAVQGSTRHTCSICGDFYDTDIVEKLGHKYGSWVIEKDETCTEDGMKVRECTVCSKETEGHYETGVVLKKGHDYVPAVTPPTCTENGFTTFTCSSCGDNYVGSSIAPKGHDYGEWSVITEAKCEAAGEQVHTCTVCSFEEKSAIPAAGHKYVGTVTAPTDTAQGYTTYKCENCDASYVSDYVDALGKLISVTVDNLSLNKDQQLPLNVTVNRVGNINYTVEYTVADESIATVDENGVVTGKARGTTQITCTVTDDKGASVTGVCSVEVTFTVLQWITWIFVDVIFGFIMGLFAPQA